MSSKKEESLADKVIVGAVMAASGLGPLFAAVELMSGEKATPSRVASAAGLADLDGSSSESPSAKQK
ncbi:MAG: hypothetical protein E6Q88_03395 [Lysobacteraceae bacterium]|nr:MAG: hypothetical protein E6Q88_03395 [Xanthomonadaceae bacterium]